MGDVMRRFLRAPLVILGGRIVRVDQRSGPVTYDLGTATLRRVRFVMKGGVVYRDDAAPAR